jgi:anti-sigma factor ChrR (cupin superfamily)
MNTLDEFLADHQAGPALELLVQTTAAVRGDADFVQRPGDVVGGAVLSQEAPINLSADALDAVMAQIDRSATLDESAAAQAVKGGRVAEVATLPSPVREAALAAMAREPWRFGGFGIRRLTLMADVADHGEGAFIELMRIEPGRGAP